MKLPKEEPFIIGKCLQKGGGVGLKYQLRRTRGFSNWLYFRRSRWPKHYQRNGVLRVHQATSIIQVNVSLGRELNRRTKQGIKRLERGTDEKNLIARRNSGECGDYSSEGIHAVNENAEQVKSVFSRAK